MESSISAHLQATEGRATLSSMTTVRPWAAWRPASICRPVDLRSQAEPMPAAPGVDVRLFGPVTVRDGSGMPLAFAYRKATALFAVLCENDAREVERATMQAMLWPDKSEEEAARNLRNALTMVRRVLRSVAGPCPLAADKRSVALSRSPGVYMDLTRFAAASAGHDHDRADTLRVSRLEMALQAYRGPFLADLTLPECPAFEAWVALRRERFHLEAVSIATELLQAYEESGDGEAALRTARRLAELQPLDERAYRAMIYWTAGAGDRLGALRIHELFAEQLADEFGSAPGPEIALLVEQLRVFRLPRFSRLGTARLRTSAESVHLLTLYARLEVESVDAETADAWLGQLLTRIENQLLPAGFRVLRDPLGGVVAHLLVPTGEELVASGMTRAIAGMSAIAAQWHGPCLDMALKSRDVDQANQQDIGRIADDEAFAAFELAQRNVSARFEPDGVSDRFPEPEMRVAA